MSGPPLQYQPGAPWTNGPSEAHLAQIAAAKKLGVKIQRAAATASFSGWSCSIFAFLTLAFCSISFSALTLLLGVGMAMVAVYEFKGAAQLRKLDPTAPRRLAMNQLCFAGMLMAYGLIMLISTLRNPPDLAAELGNDPQVRQMIGPITDLEQPLTILMYVIFIVAAVAGPGLTSWYYASRRKYVEAYLAETPQWIIDLQRSGMSL